MAPMKFEEQMKEKLDQRHIKPSDSAWEKITSQMSSNKGSKRKNSYFRYGIAAGFIGIILVSVIYFIGQDTSGNDQIDIVDREKLIDPIEKLQTEKNEGEQQVTLEFKKKSAIEKDHENTMGTAEVNVQNYKEDYSKTRPIANNATNIAKQAKREDLPAQTNEVIDAKIAQLVEQMDFLEQNQVEVTNAEIDSLLRKAQQEILQEQLFLKNNSVDAMALLTQVEDEMDQSFRDQIFDALRDGFLKVRTAVATRNE